jgi:hypothetical protein
MLKKAAGAFFRKARLAYVFACAEQRGKASLTQRARPVALRPGYSALIRISGRKNMGT